jgi:hypothetical protein
MRTAIPSSKTRHLSYSNLRVVTQPGHLFQLQEKLEDELGHRLAICLSIGKISKNGDRE